MAKFGFSLKELRLVTPDFIQQNPELAESPLDYALRYVALGWWVLPCDRDKRPLPGHSLLTATNNPTRVRAIWTEHPEAGVAVSCARSGLVVLDVDPRNGGYETLARLEAEHGPLPSTVVSLTQGGGEHRFFRHAENTPYPVELGPGVDVKHNGYVLVEPSLGLKGAYRWAEGRDPTRGAAAPPAPAPLSAAPAADHHAERTHAPASIIVAPQVYAELESALRTLDPEMPYPEWLRVLYALSRLSDAERAHALAREWSLRSRRPGHTPAAFESKWRSVNRERSAVSYETVFWAARQVGWAGVPTPTAEATVGTTLPPEAMPGLYGLEDYDLENLPPVRFVIPDWLPAGRLTLFSGHGGSGKSSVALHVAAALAAGGRRTLLGQEVGPEPLRVLFVSGEDEPLINMTRMRALLRSHPDWSRAALAANLKFIDVAGLRGNALVAFDTRSGRAVYTPLYEHLQALAAEFLPELIILDNNSILFGGNEIDRGQIQTYIHGVQQIHPPAAVLALHHVDKASLAREDGEGWSGSTQWHNGARARWTLSPVEGEITLVLRKTNYGAPGWRGAVAWDPETRSHRLGEFTLLTREEEAAARADRRDATRVAVSAAKSAEDRNTVLAAVIAGAERRPSAYGLLSSLGGRYDAYRRALRELIDSGAVLELELPPGERGAGGNRQRTYLAPAPAAEGASPYQL